MTQDVFSLFRSHFTDDEGWEIFEHWLNGRGEPVCSRDDHRWSVYMMANEKLRGNLLVYLHAHTDLWVLKTSGAFTLNLGLETYPLGDDSFWFLGDDYSSGYELLHQPAYNQYGAAAFVMSGYAMVYVTGDEYTIHYDNEYTWEDYCRPNSGIPLDQLEAELIKAGGLLLEGKIVGQDYKRTIIWHAPVDIKAKIDKTGKVVFEYQYGWPFEPVARGILTR